MYNRSYNITFSHACAHHNVHLGLEQDAEDVVREDDRHLADLQPAPPLHRSPRPHIHGQSQVTQRNQNIWRNLLFILAKKYFLCNKNVLFELSLKPVLIHRKLELPKR